jgi:hypothetical protein
MADPVEGAWRARCSVTMICAAPCVKASQSLSAESTVVVLPVACCSERMSARSPHVEHCMSWLCALQSPEAYKTLLSEAVA